MAGLEYCHFMQATARLRCCHALLATLQRAVPVAASSTIRASFTLLLHVDKEDTTSVHSMLVSP